MEQKIILLTVLGMSLVTVLIKVIPIVTLSAQSIPKGLSDMLQFLPVAVLAAMVAQFILIRDGTMVLSAGNLFVWAAALTAFVGIITRNLFVTILVGMGFVALTRLVLV